MKPKGKDVRNFARDLILAIVAGLTVAVALYALRKAPVVETALEI